MAVMDFFSNARRDQVDAVLVGLNFLDAADLRALPSSIAVISSAVPRFIFPILGVFGGSG